MSAHRIVSLWDLMEQIKAREILEGFGSMATLSQKWFAEGPGTNQIMHRESFLQYRKKVENLAYGLAALEAPITLEFVKTLLACFDQAEIVNGDTRVFRGQNYGNAHAAIMQLTNVIAPELGQKFFVALRGTNKELFDQNYGLFGEQVELVFPDAIGDISEAGKCLALERYTAAVFHMMRAMEAGVGRLAQEVQATVTKENGETLPWGVLVSNVKAKIDRLPSGEKQDNWLKLHALLHSANRAYRTKTAHPKDTYTEAEATAAFHATKSFMQEMAGLLSKAA